MNDSNAQPRRTRVLIDLSKEQDGASLPSNGRSLFWTVPPKHGDDEYRVDLRALLPRAGGEYIAIVSRVTKLHVQRPTRPAREIKIARPELLQELASSIHAFTMSRPKRTYTEALSCFRWFFCFLDEMPVLRPDLPAVLHIADCDERLGVEYAEWLRRQEGIGSLRMGSLYTAASQFLSDATERRVWAPSPFRGGPSNEDEPAYTERQYLALHRMSKQVVSAFWERRRAYRMTRLEVDRIDPHGNVRANQVAMAERPKFGIRNRVRAARRALITGNAPDQKRWNDHCVAPTPEFVAATFLHVLCRSNTNEQPLLDIRRGAWMSSNPFGPEYRTITLWKNRSGHKGVTAKTRISLAFSWDPTFYPPKLLRYQELLSGWCLKVMHACPGKSGRMKTSADRSAGLFWIYWNEGRWCRLDEQSSHRLINALIAAQAAAWPDLRGEDGEPIRYSARALRDAYLAFALKWSGFNLATGQQEISHSPDSNAIKGYLRKPWARSYANDQLREFQSASRAVLDSDQPALTPKAIKEAFRERAEGNIPTPGKIPKETKVRHGFKCKDAQHPPENVYQPKDESDSCPAEHCHDCPHARMFRSGLPELARDILDLRARRDQVSIHLWHGSTAHVELIKLEEVLARFPEPQQQEGFAMAEWLQVPALTYVPRLT